MTMHLCFSALRYHCTCWVPAGCEVSEDGTLDPDLLAACMRPDQARRCKTHTHRGDLHTHTYTEAHSRASLTIMQGFRCAVLQYNTGMDADKFGWSLWNNARNDTEAAKKLIEQAWEYLRNEGRYCKVVSSGSIAEKYRHQQCILNRQEESMFAVASFWLHTPDSFVVRREQIPAVKISDSGPPSVYKCYVFFFWMDNFGYKRVLPLIVSQMESFNLGSVAWKRGLMGSPRIKKMPRRVACQEYAWG